MPIEHTSTARDRSAEIDAAITALTGATGPVTAAPIAAAPIAAAPIAGEAIAGGPMAGGSGTTADRRIHFVHSDGLGDPARGWLRFTGAPGQLAADGPVLNVGLGPAAESTVESVRAAAMSAGTELTAGTVAVVFPAGREELVTALIDGLATSYAGTGHLELRVGPDALEPARLGILTADTVRLARLMVSAPPNVLTPERAAHWAEEIAAGSGLDCTVLGPQEIGEQGFGALEAIGAGSVNGPRLVRLTHTGVAGGPVVSLVGKGITFDSGGLSLKSPAAMANMRLDVAGAATVLAVMGSLTRSGCPITVHAVLPFAENLPGPGAVRPGDVVTAWNGTQIQILDTDFEGRVVLADALALAAADKPDLLVDLATLTYQAEIALGPEIGAVLARDDVAAQHFLSSAAAAGEPMWRLPWAPRYLDQVRTPFGVRNHPLRDSGRALTAALFLGEFVPESVSWVHCDMTGPAWSGDASVDGATGFGTRTLLRLLADLTPDHAVRAQDNPLFR